MVEVKAWGDFGWSEGIRKGIREENYPIGNNDLSYVTDTQRMSSQQSRAAHFVVGSMGYSKTPMGS